jgi:hypothetical protein
MNYQRLPIFRHLSVGARNTSFSGNPHAEMLVESDSRQSRGGALDDVSIGGNRALAEFVECSRRQEFWNHPGYAGARIAAHQFNEYLLGVVALQERRKFECHRRLCWVGARHGKFDPSDRMTADDGKKIQWGSADLRAKLLLQYRQQKAFR